MLLYLNCVASDGSKIDIFLRVLINADFRRNRIPSEGIIHRNELSGKLRFSERGDYDVINKLFEAMFEILLSKTHPGPVDRATRVLGSKSCRAYFSSVISRFFILRLFHPIACFQARNKETETSDNETKHSRGSRASDRGRRIGFIVGSMSNEIAAGMIHHRKSKSGRLVYSETRPVIIL